MVDAKALLNISELPKQELIRGKKKKQSTRVPL